MIDERNVRSAKYNGDSVSRNIADEDVIWRRKADRYSDTLARVKMFLEGDGLVSLSEQHSFLTDYGMNKMENFGSIKFVNRKTWRNWNDAASLLKKNWKKSHAGWDILDHYLASKTKPESESTPESDSEVTRKQMKTSVISGCASTTTNMEISF